MSQTGTALHKQDRRPFGPWVRYGQGAGLVVIATLLSDWLHPLFSPANLVMIYLLAVVVAAIFLGRGPSILVSVLSVLAWDLFFVPPTLTLVVSDTQDLFAFLALLVVGLVISNLTALTREQADAAEQRAAQNAELYALSRDLAVAASLEAILQTTVAHVGETFGRQAVILAAEGERVRPWAASPDLRLVDEELAAAQWALCHERAAGRGTEVMASASLRWLPLRTARGVVGVLGVRPTDPSSNLTPEQRQLLDTFASQAALAIERAQLAEQARQAEVLRATEQLHTALLDSISHDLRTPLVSILGALSSLQEDGEGLDPATRRSLVDNARDEAERLNRLVGNLLDMTRIEAGALQVMWELCDVQDLIGAAVDQVENRQGDQAVVRIDVAPDLPLVPLDFVLMEQVLVNLVDNAYKYTPSGSPVDIRAYLSGEEVHLQVADRGIGIPADALTRVFSKFYRGQAPKTIDGTGLGLSICKGIVEAHGGRIWAEVRAGGGSAITVALPLGARGEKIA